MFVFVRNYIEKHIDLIEKQDWSAFWDQWARTGDEYYLPSLLKTLYDSGCIDQETSSWTRQEAVLRQLEKAFNQGILLNGLGKLTFKGAYLCLNSTFDFSSAQLEDLIKRFATKHNIEFVQEP